MGAFEDYERFTTEPEDVEVAASCDACGGGGCPKCVPDMPVEQSLTYALDCILTGTPFGGAR